MLRQLRDQGTCIRLLGISVPCAESIEAHGASGHGFSCAIHVKSKRGMPWKLSSKLQLQLKLKLQLKPQLSVCCPISSATRELGVQAILSKVMQRKHIGPFTTSWPSLLICSHVLHQARACGVCTCGEEGENFPSGRSHAARG